MDIRFWIGRPGDFNSQPGPITSRGIQLEKGYVPVNFQLITYISGKMALGPRVVLVFA